MTNRNANLLGTMDVKKALIKLSIPATIGMIVNATYNLVDSLFVGWGAGEIAIGALTLANPIQMIVVALALMIGVGGASVFSRAYGAGNKEKMDATVNGAVRFGIISGLTLTILTLIFMNPLLDFFGATPDNLGFAKDYLGIVAFGMTFQTLSMILNNMTRAEGRAKVAMQAMVLGAGLNILLDPIFIFDWGLGLGVKGAALATVLSQLTSFSFITFSSFSKDSVLAISLRRFFNIDYKVLKETIKIGLPSFMRNAVGAVLAIIIIKMIGFYTAETDRSTYLAIFGVMNRVLLFIFMPGFGMVQGFAPIAGFNFGAKNWERLVELIKFATKLLVVYFIGGFLFIQFGATLVFDVFSSSDDVFFIETGARIFRIVSLGLIFISFQVIAGAIYQSFGYAKRALFISLSRQLILFIPLSLILTAIFGLNGLWYTYFVADILSGIIGLIMVIFEVRVLRTYKNGQEI
jgi:putative MATE family efflux protein